MNKCYMLYLFVLFMFSLLKKWFDVKKKVIDKPKVGWVYL